MKINTQNTMSITEANQNFSKAVKMADKNGSVVIFRHNKPQYIISSIENSVHIDMTDEEKIMFIGQRVLREHLNAFKELAK